MWFILILYALLTLAKGEMRLCSTPVHSVCRSPNNYYTSIPRDSEQLLEICPSLGDHLECLHSYDLACRGRSEYIGIRPPLYYHRLKSILDDACDETSSLHRALGRGLPCIKTRVSRSGFICSSTKEKVLTAYENYLASGSSKKFRKTQAKKQCLSLIATLACMMEDIETECGFLAYEVAKDIILRSQIFPDECGLDVFQELKDVVGDLTLESSIKNKLRKYFVVEIE